MKITASGGVALIIAWLVLAAEPSARQDRPGATETTPEKGKGAKGRVFSGRVVDGLGRPVPDVSVRLLNRREGQERPPDTVLHTGEDGRFSVVRASGDDDAVISFEKDGYGAFSAIATSGREFILNRKVDWDETSMLPYAEGDTLDRGARECLASEEWSHLDGDLLGFLFKYQGEFRPALRRLIPDKHVGADARDWLDLLDDPADRDLFPEDRRYKPGKEVKETDLVEALKATALHRNFNSSAPVPTIAIDFIKFTNQLDRVLIQCGINRVAMTGITWQFVFRKAGKQWELRSAKEAGRS